jgi:uncharacterized protein YciI
MTIYAVQYDYSDDTAARDEHRPAHREFIGGLADEGVVLVSGPYAAAEPAGALLVVRADDEAEVRELLREDPFQQQGLVELVRVREWTPILGSRLEAFAD